MICSRASASSLRTLGRGRLSRCARRCASHQQHPQLFMLSRRWPLGPRFTSLLLRGLSGRLVGRREDVRLAGVELALDAPDDPVSDPSAHDSFQRMHLDIIAGWVVFGGLQDWRLHDRTARPGSEGYSVFSGVLFGLDHYGIIAKLFHL